MQNENGSPKKSLLSAQVDLSKFDSSYFRAATEEEKKQQDVMSESTTFFKDGIRRLKKNPLAMGSLVVLILILLIHSKAGILRIILFQLVLLFLIFLSTL